MGMREGSWLDHLGRMVGKMVGAPPGPLSLAQALPWLVPKVRPRFEYEAFSLRFGRPAPEFRPLAGVFAVSLVVDFPDREVDVGAAELAAWGVDFDRLMQKARSNLLARGDEEQFQQVKPGVYQSTWEDNLDGSRVLLPGILQRLELAGDPVVVLPSRDALLVTGSENPRGLQWMLEAALEFLTGDPRSLNGCPLRLRHYLWEPFHPREELPICPLVVRIHHQRLQEEYALQKRLLDQRHGALGQRITLAPFHLQRTPGGKSSSYTVWSRTMEEAWLPEADRMRLSWDAAAGPLEAWIPWELVQRQLSHLLEPIGLFPERYRFKAPPQIDLLRSL
jgi:hypothetical protein